MVVMINHIPHKNMLLAASRLTMKVLKDSRTWKEYQMLICAKYFSTRCTPCDVYMPTGNNAVADVRAVYREISF